MARVLICCCTEHSDIQCPNCPSHGDRITQTVSSFPGKRKVVMAHNEDYWSYDIYPLNERISV